MSSAAPRLPRMSGTNITTPSRTSWTSTSSGCAASSIGRRSHRSFERDAARVISCVRCRGIVQLSLRARLTAWYSVLLVFTVAGFRVSVLWVHWPLLLTQFDESLDATSATADNVVDEELRELSDLRLAIDEMLEVVRPARGLVQVLDAGGTPVNRADHGLPLSPGLLRPGDTLTTLALTAKDGKRWRVDIRTRETAGIRYYVAAGAPLDEPLEQWQRLLKACVVGLPLALVFAGLGGFWVVRYGLRPLTAMAAEAQAITASTLELRLTVPAATPEFARIGEVFNHVQ